MTSAGRPDNERYIGVAVTYSVWRDPVASPVQFFQSTVVSISTADTITSELLAVTSHDVSFRSLA